MQAELPGNVTLHGAMCRADGHERNKERSRGGPNGWGAEWRVTRSGTRGNVAALDHAHQQEVIHRDVKPNNVLLDGEWAALTDFGLAKMTEASVKLTLTGVGIGTPAYMSPVQGQGLRVCQRTDIYSLGVILFEMLTGRIPYNAETLSAIVLKRATEPLPLPSASNPEIPEAVERVVLKALAPNPDDRCQSAGALTEAPQEVGGGLAEKG
jgi:serine/threonine protein kinase